jgi:hypothetical protein
MSAVKLSKAPTLSQKPTAVLRWTWPYTRQYLDWVKPILKRTFCEILKSLLETHFSSGLHGPVKFSIRLIIHTKSVVHMKWLVIIILYIVQVITLRSSTNFYSILTHCVLQFDITRTVPVCCIAQDFEVTFFTVEHKKLRIRKDLL